MCFYFFQEGKELKLIFKFYDPQFIVFCFMTSFLIAIHEPITYFFIEEKSFAVFYVVLGKIFPINVFISNSLGFEAYVACLSLMLSSKDAKIK